MTYVYYTHCGAHSTDEDNHYYEDDKTPSPVPIAVHIHRELIPLSSRDSNFILFEDLFVRGWKHKGKDASIKSIHLFPSGKRLNNPAISYLFHGTRRACTIGEERVKPCHNIECNLCSILRNSFRLNLTGTDNMFGPGIYTTPVSSKADIYAMNHHIQSNQHAILVCQVVSSRPQLLYRAEPNRHRPDPGYDSVLAATRDEGGSVDFPELVVYSEDAVVPCGLIMYARRGWTP